MSNIIMGINPTRVDTEAQYPLGLEVDDPRGGEYAGNRIRYVKATASGVAAGKALQFDIGASTGPPSLRGRAMIPTATTTPLTQIVSALAHVAIANGSFGWVTVHGIVFGATVPDSLAVGTTMIGGAAGALVDSSGAGTETAELDWSLASGKRVILVEDTGTSLGTVFID
ncbi:MAG TPA: hypothetical protein VJ302_16795 [Blastocatellia bacterium]|nr:hypothetical protein [Blastocatellia bacterium]